MKRRIVEIDETRCDGCGQCIPACAEGAIEIVGGKARLAAERYCDGLGACLGHCPKDAIQVVEREADPFDEEAVEAYVREKGKGQPGGGDLPILSCPSAQVHSFSREELPPFQGQAPAGDTPSCLTHWPVQIALVPPSAPFLRGADLLVAADCTPCVRPDFHGVFLKGKVLLIGCPKFDDTREILEKFTEIFRQAQIRSVTVLIMEVPCCSALPMILKEAMERAGKEIPMEELVLSLRGEVLGRRRVQCTQ